MVSLRQIGIHDIAKQTVSTHFHLILYHCVICASVCSTNQIYCKDIQTTCRLVIIDFLCISHDTLQTHKLVILFGKLIKTAVNLYTICQKKVNEFLVVRAKHYLILPNTPSLAITHVEPVIKHQSEISEANRICYLTAWYANEAY